MKTLSISSGTAVLGALALFAVSLAVPSSALAVSITDLTIGGNPNITGTVNQNVTVRVRAELGFGEDVESVMTNFLEDDLAPVCFDVQDEISEGIREFDVRVKLPRSSGNYDLEVTTFGLSGAGTSQDCQPGDENGGPTEFDDQFTVVYNNDSTSGSGSGNTVQSGGASSSNGNSNDQKLQSLIDLITLWIAKMTPPTGTGGGGTALCPAVVLSSLSIGSTGPQVVQLQSWLMSHGYPIPALSAGAAYGYYGPQTSNAVYQLKMAVPGCN